MFVHSWSILNAESLLATILPADVGGIYVVVMDECGHESTFMLDGMNATYLGTGDMHDQAFSNTKYTASLTSSATFLGPINRNVNKIRAYQEILQSVPQAPCQVRNEQTHMASGIQSHVVGEV